MPLRKIVPVPQVIGSYKMPAHQELQASEQRARFAGKEHRFMQITQLWAQSLMAILGGLACELLHWYSLSRKPGGAARFAGRPVYWITTVGMILLAGVMPPLYLQGTSSALLCFHLGAATPILLQKLVASAPQLVRGQGAAGAGGATFAQFLGGSGCLGSAS